MKIIDLIKRAICAVTCSGIILSAPVWTVNDMVSADEPAYNIVLSAETVEYDLGKHSGDRTADIKLSIENNPGFSEMYIIIEKSSQLSFYYPSSPVSSSGKYSGIKNELFDENKDIVFLTVPSYKSNTENGTFANIKVKLPDEVHPGDYYEIKFLDSFSIPERELTKEPGILMDKVLTGKTSFSQMISGGIKIIETAVTEAPKTDDPVDTPSDENNAPPQNEQQPSDQGNNEQQPSDQGNNEQQPEQTEAPQTEVSSTEITTVPGTSAAAQNAAVSSGTTNKNTTQAVTDSDIKVTGEQNDAMASSDKIQMKPDRTIETILIIAIIVVSILGIVTFIGLFKYYRKKDNK